MTNTPQTNGQKKQTPQDSGVSTMATPGSPANNIIYQFRELKKLRNNHQIDEPDFDEGVMELIKADRKRLLDKVDKLVDLWGDNYQLKQDLEQLRKEET